MCGTNTQYVLHNKANLTIINILVYWQKEFNSITKMKINRIVIKNIGPIGYVDLKLDGKSVVLAGTNGSGKTLALSSVVDHIYETLNYIGFHDILPTNGIGYKYYRIASHKLKKVGAIQGYVYIRSAIGDSNFFYLEQYGYEDPSTIAEELGIPKEDIPVRKNEDSLSKQIQSDIKTNNTKIEARKLVSQEAIFYLPAMRYEDELWRNDEFIIQANDTSGKSYNRRKSFQEYLGRPIEILTSSQDNIRWFLNVALDSFAVSRGENIYNHKISNINKILQMVLQNNNVVLGLNSFDYEDRLTVQDLNHNEVVPSLQLLSMGQQSVFNMFMNILRIGDKNQPMDQISGLVVIDEVDAHLHTKLKSDVVPELIKLFPNVQFIMTTQSTTFMLGIGQHDTKIKIINLPDGREINPEQFQEIKEVTDRIKETEAFQREVSQLVKNQTKPILAVEDQYTEIYKVAWLKINKIADVNSFNLHEKFKAVAPFVIYGKQGHGNLKNFLNQPNLDELEGRKVVGLFDFDDAYTSFNQLAMKWNSSQGEGDDATGRYSSRRDYPNCSAMLLPVPEWRKNVASSNQASNSKLEIELLFKDPEIKAHCSKIIKDGVTRLEFNSEDKATFWQEALSFGSDKFQGFIPLFCKVEELLGVSTIQA